MRTRSAHEFEPETQFEIHGVGHTGIEVSKPYVSVIAGIPGNDVILTFTDLETIERCIAKLEEGRDRLIAAALAEQVREREVAAAREEVSA